MTKYNLDPIVEQYDALFLDNDGTCGMTEELHAKIGTQILQEAGVEDITYQERLSLMGYGERGIWDYLHGQNRTPRISKEEFQNLQAERFLQALKNLDDSTKIARPGIRALAEAFHNAGKPVIVVSNTPRDVVVAIQEAVGTLDIVDQIIALDDLHKLGLKAKPEPDGYNLAKKITRFEFGCLDTGKYLAVEDAYKGWLAAEAAYCDTMHIYYNSIEQTPNPRATYVVADHLDVREAFNKHMPHAEQPSRPQIVVPTLNLGFPGFVPAAP